MGRFEQIGVNHEMVFENSGVQAVWSDIASAGTKRNAAHEELSAKATGNAYLPQLAITMGVADVAAGKPSGFSRVSRGDDSKNCPYYEGPNYGRGALIGATIMALPGAAGTIATVAWRNPRLFFPVWLGLVAAGALAGVYGEHLRLEDQEKFCRRYR